MKLLPDENLSPRLVRRLSSLFPDLTHVRDMGLKQASDKEIWKAAKENGYTVITTDVDFVTLSGSLGWPPKVVHLERCTFPFATIEQLLRRNAILITEFDRNLKAGVLTLRLHRS